MWNYLSSNDIRRLDAWSSEKKRCFEFIFACIQFLFGIFKLNAYLDRLGKKLTLHTWPSFKTFKTKPKILPLILIIVDYLCDTLAEFDGHTQH